MQNIELAKAYFESVLDKPLSQMQYVQLGGMRVLEILWPVNDIFRHRLNEIRGIPYSKHHGREADAAIEAFSAKPVAQTWQDFEPIVWRVLLERHHQMLMVAATNEVQGFPLTSVPDDLPESAVLPAVMLLLLHGMQLPWPPGDRSELELPEADGPETMLHR
ncbi:MAG: hypothetical protein L0H73_04945 [Nitrococcus sp.]|nr:hypothetical protein [Nitrococcus sp.]